MLFSGVPFLFYFLPIVCLLYFIAPKVLKNTILLLASLVFYAWGEPKLILVMLVSIAVSYGCGLAIEKNADKPVAKVFLICAIVIGFGLLGYFKYAGFFVETFSSLTGIGVPALRIALPIGISFYTFQSVSYVIDVYRGHTPARKNPIKLALYVSFFPQLIAGPIVRYSDVRTQLDHRKSSLEDISAGIRRFVFGLSKKVLLANPLGELCTIFQDSGDQSVLFFWLYAIAFTLQIYFDFSGYSDMAIGLGRIFGFHFPENFNFPYIAGSITDFWRRWHMTLGTWFRDYVYIPLGGNRCSKGRQVRNILLVWALTGFWHGAEWTFLVWGLFYGVLLLVEKQWLRARIERTRVIKHVYVMLFVVLGFVIFDAGSLSEAGTTIAAMFGFGGFKLISTQMCYYAVSYTMVFAVAIIAATPLAGLCVKKLRENAPFNQVLNTLEPLYLLALLLLSTAYLVDGSFNPFLYFRF